MHKEFSNSAMKAVQENEFFIHVNLSNVENIEWNT